MFVIVARTRENIHLRPNKKIPVFRVLNPTLPIFTGETLILSGILEKNYFYAS